jgi:hypothetical protein
MLTDVGTLVQDEGLNAPPQPQPHQPRLEEIFTYNTTVDPNALPCLPVEPGSQRWDLEVPSEQQPPPPPGNFASYIAAQYDEAPAWSNTTAIATVNSNDSSTNHVSASSSSSNGNKRKLEDHVGVFSIRSNPEENRRKRKAFDPDTRKAVAVVRKVGSCSRCKARRIKVSDVPDLMLPSDLIMSSATFQAHAWRVGRRQRVSVSQSISASARHC